MSRIESKWTDIPELIALKSRNEYTIWETFLCKRYPGFTILPRTPLEMPGSSCMGRFKVILLGIRQYNLYSETTIWAESGLI